MTHELKIWPQYYARVADGSKTFEVRDNDRGFQCGDSVLMREWDPEKASCFQYSGRQITARIGYVYPIDDKRAVFSLIGVIAT